MKKEKQLSRSLYLLTRIKKTLSTNESLSTMGTLYRRISDKNEETARISTTIRKRRFTECLICFI